MTKLIIWGLTFISFLTVTLLGTQIARADISKNPILPEGQTHHGFFIRTDEKVEVNGEVIGDVWAVGNAVTINGKVHGSVYAIGQKIAVNGVVDGNLQLAASSVEVNGQVGGASYVAASEIKTSQQSLMNNGAILVGSVIDLTGPISNQTILAGSIIKLNSSINGNLTIMGSQAELGLNAKVAGDLKYNQDLKIVIANDKAIYGSIIKTQEFSKKPTIIGRLRDVLFTLLISLVTGLIIIAILPKSTQAVADHIKKHLLRSFFVGLGFIILVPILVFILLITFFGLQIGVLLALGYVTVLIIGELFVAICIGNFITHPKKVDYASLATSLVIGLIVLAILKILPLLGGIVASAVFTIGVGAVFSSILHKIKVVRTSQMPAKVKK